MGASGKRARRRQKKKGQNARQAGGASKGKGAAKRPPNDGSDSTPGGRAKRKPKGFMGALDQFYHDNYKPLLLIPFLMLLAAIGLLIFNFATTGGVVATGVSLSGGLTITVPTADNPIAVDAVTDALSQFPNDIVVREIAEFGSQQAIMIEAAPTSGHESDLETLEQELVGALETVMPGIRGTYSVEIIGPSLGQAFLEQTLTALLAAFVFMALVVFFIFRTPIPSGAVVLAAFSDMIVTLAVISMTDMKLGTAGIAAFLMLIGYSVDTDILLSTRVLKREEGTVYSRIKSAIGTGLLMNITTLAAILVALFVSQSDIIRQIMTILLVGLLVDIINTWIQNAGILRWYAEKKRL